VKVQQLSFNGAAFSFLCPAFKHNWQIGGHTIRKWRVSFVVFPTNHSRGKGKTVVKTGEEENLHSGKSFWLFGPLVLGQIVPICSHTQNALGLLFI
jgi:hypothetical protein